MIISQYTIPFEGLDHDFFLYNSFSNALVEVDKDSYEKIVSLSGTDSLIHEDDIDHELYKALVGNHFIVESHSDEFLLYKSLIMEMRGQSEFMHLTVAPTTDCNFRCFYCFEKEKKPYYLKESTMDSIILYLKSFRDLKRIKLTWFGGEPLLAKDEMRAFYGKIKELGLSFTSNIITSGFLVDESTTELFNSLDISDVQITLDGNKESHNKVKQDKSCSDVFSRVIQNAQLLLSKCEQLHITFRVNITRENSHEYVELYRFLNQTFDNKKVSVVPAFVEDRTKSCALEKNHIVFSKHESSDYILELYHKDGIYTPFLQYPSKQISECAIRNKMAISFDAEGYVYKCWEKIGDKHYSIGRINEKGEIENVNRIELNRELYGADPLDSEECKQCRLLPICNGGCPIQRIQNEFEEYSNDVCPYYKDSLSDYLNIHIQLKKGISENS